MMSKPPYRRCLGFAIPFENVVPNASNQEASFSRFLFLETENLILFRLKPFGSVLIQLKI